MLKSPKQLSVNYAQVLRASRPARLLTCRDLHFTEQVTPLTDFSLGDCSYLNTCHREGCKFVHYKTPRVPVIKQEPPRDAVARYLNVDIRQLNIQRLGKFSVIICDPPWTIRQTLPYGTLTDNEFCKLNLGELQSSGDLLFLWTTGRVIDHARKCLASWGYRDVEELIWVKVNQLQRPVVSGRTGHWLNHSKETCLGEVDFDLPKNFTDCVLLVARKGPLLATNAAASYRPSFELNYICSEVRETSHKPDELYGIAERLVGHNGRKLEIFARSHNLRPGWHFIGDQIDPNNIPPGVVAQDWTLA